jgi:hypothetical protein
MKNVWNPPMNSCTAPAYPRARVEARPKATFVRKDSGRVA